MTDVTEIREMDDDELYSRLIEAKQEMFNLRFQHVTGQLDNYSRLGDVRKDIARLNTILREREIDAAEKSEGGKQPETPEAPEADDARRRRRDRVAASRKAQSSDDDDETTSEENGG